MQHRRVLSCLWFRLISARSAVLLKSGSLQLLISSLVSVQMDFDHLVFLLLHCSGNSGMLIATKIPTMATTTRSSASVKPPCFFFICYLAP